MNYKHAAVVAFTLPVLALLQQPLKLCKLVGCLLISPHNRSAPFPAAPRTAARTAHRDPLFTMGLQLALLLAGIVALSDSARGKDRAAPALLLAALPCTRAPLLPPGAAGCSVDLCCGRRWARMKLSSCIPFDFKGKQLHSSVDQKYLSPLVIPPPSPCAVYSHQQM